MTEGRPPASAATEEAHVLRGTSSCERLAGLTPSPIPLQGRPVPTLQVTGFPQHCNNTAAVKDALERCEGIKVADVYFVHGTEGGSSVALVRLQPLDLPSATEQASSTSQASEANAVLDNADAGKSAAGAAGRLNSMQPPLKLGDKRLYITVDEREAQLFVGNLPAEWSSEDLAAAVRPYGELWRAFVMRSSNGCSKKYGFVEFQQAAAADACLKALEADERQHRFLQQPGRAVKDAGVAAGPSSCKVADITSATSAGPPGSKSILRAEKADLRRADRLHARRLHLSNLPAGRSPKQVEGELRAFAEQYGKVRGVHLGQQKRGRGYAFVEFESEAAAARAFHALQQAPAPQPLKACFANPTAYPGLWQRRSGPAAKRDGSRLSGQVRPTEVKFKILDVATMAAKTQTAPTAKRGRPAKDSSKPKKAQTAYLYFCGMKMEEVRAMIMAANPECKPDQKQVMKELGKAWTKAQEDKTDGFKQCVQLAEADKGRYSRELAEWERKNNEALQA